jgi:hypothetical protein
MWDMIVAVWCNFKKLVGMKTRTYDYELVPIENDEEPIENRITLPPVWW